MPKYLCSRAAFLEFCSLVTNASFSIVNLPCHDNYTNCWKWISNQPRQSKIAKIAQLFVITSSSYMKSQPSNEPSKISRISWDCATAFEPISEMATQNLSRIQCGISKDRRDRHILAGNNQKIILELTECPVTCWLGNKYFWKAESLFFQKILSWVSSFQFSHCILLHTLTNSKRTEDTLLLQDVSH